MPPRGKTPGLKGGRFRPELGRRLPYWMASQILPADQYREIKDLFPDPCIPLPPEASEEELAELCRRHTARLNAWLDAQAKAGQQDDAEALPALPPYTGTIDSACDWYELHPRSRFRTVKGNTRKTYLDSLKVIRPTVGKRLIRNLTILDVQHWYEEWRKPVVYVDEQGNETVGPERIKRAHDAVAMVKTVLRFNAALRRADCKQLIEDLEKATSLTNFEKGGARNQELTYAQTRDFIRTALDLQARGILPGLRGLYMAIGVATQFETTLRQRDTIGERPKNAADLEKARRNGATVLDGGDRPWAGTYTWENIPGWRWRTRTSKSKYRQAAVFTLTNYDLLFPLLELVPHEERHGAIVKGEHGLPIQERSYRKWFRQIARIANIPDEVWLMDSRAGGATEAEEAGVDRKLVSAALTHTNERTTGRYIKATEQAIASVAHARRRKRAIDGGANG